LPTGGRGSEAAAVLPLPLLDRHRNSLLRADMRLSFQAAGIKNPVRHHQQSHQDESDVNNIGQFHMHFDGARAILVHFIHP
jgi:hypothetical protein